MATTNKVKGWTGVLMTEDSSSHWTIKRRYVYSETSRRAGLEFVCIFGHDEVERASVRLFEQRQRAVAEVIEPVEEYVNRLAHSPKEFDKSVREFRIEVDRFSETIQRIETEAYRSETVGGAAGVSGAAAGVGVATLGPSVAMAVATTFGTASTGTAISTLSGAAAANAALAWLGGGAVAAGGGGMAAGKALPVLVGPVGWTIGGVALAGSGIYLHCRNGELARRAVRERVEVEAEMRSLRTADGQIEGLGSSTRTHVVFTLNREDFSFVIHLDRQPRTSRRREAQTGSRARSGSRSERTLDAVEHSRTLMEWWPFLIFHRGGLRIKVINNNTHHGKPG